MKFLRTIRLDDSDLNVFPLAAAPGEWAVTGTFAFADVDPESLAGKDRQAFRNGWLGTDSFGRSTLVQVVDITERQFEKVIRDLAAHFMEHYKPPHLLAALDAARQEADYAQGLCEHDASTLLALERSFEGDGIAERVRVIPPKHADAHHLTQIWTVLDEE